MSIAATLQNKIDKLDAGSVFCANDFSMLGERGNIDVILHRLSKNGYIRRLGFGLYDKPRRSSFLGDLTPDLSAIIGAYARRTGYIIVLDPVGAANALNLTNQVPARLRFLTNGKSHTISICEMDIIFTHASPKKIAGAEKNIGLIVQALHYFGKKTIPDMAVTRLSSRLSNKDIKALKSIRTQTLRYITPQIDRILSHAATH